MHLNRTVVIESIIDGVADKEKIKEYNFGIKKTVFAREKLIQDLFVHSQLELNKLSINKKKHYLDKLPEEILDVAHSYIELDKRKLKQIKPYPKVIPDLDRERIEQVFVNLIANAIKYSNKNSTITISAESDSEAAYITVKDNGKGISKEELPFIFEKFYRDNKARNSTNSGVGIGLAICKYNIEAHGGTITAESTPGKGTSFKIILPLA